MTRSEKVAESLLRPINPSVIIILGVYTIVWGLWLMNPLWTVFPTAALYSAMHAIASEYVWGAIAVIAGVVTTRGALKPNYRNLQIGAGIAFLHWLTIGVLYLMGDWMNTGGITCFAFALYSAIVWLNIKVNRTHYG